MDSPADNGNPAPARRQPSPRRADGRLPLIFAVAGIVVALVATGLYLYREAAAPRLTPEETVERFLAGVFLAESAERLDGLVCGNWDAADALTRTARQVGDDARVSWDQIAVVSASDGRATLSARLGLRFRNDVRPAAYQQWHFTLVNENGWRVCEARPFRV